MKTRARVSPLLRGDWPPCYRSVAVCFVAIFLVAANSVQAQSNTKLGFADYQNQWYTSGPAPIPGLGDYAPTCTVPYQGHVGACAAPGSTDTPTTPTDGVAFKLTQSAFGQPVGGATFFGADFYLGEEITPPEGDVDIPLNHIPQIDPPTHAFYVPSCNKLFAGDYGVVTITWISNLGTDLPVQYVISNRTIQKPVRIYHTETEKGGLVDFSHAPAGTTMQIHYNTAITTAPKMWFDANKRLHATTETGMVVMHYDQEASFAGIEIVDVRRYVADYLTSFAYVGTLMRPQNIVQDALSSPTISRGDEGPKPYVYKYGDEKAATVRDQVFPVRPTLADDKITLVTNKIYLFWKQAGRYAGVEWPYELHAYRALWDPATDWQRIYYTAGGTLGPPVAFAGIDDWQFFFNDEITTGGTKVGSVITYTGGTIWVNDAPREIRADVARTGAEEGKILLRMDDYGATGPATLEFVEVFDYWPDWTTAKDVGDQLLPFRTVSDPLQKQTLVRRGKGPNPMDPDNYVYQHAIDGAYNGAVWAVRPTQTASQIEIFFRREGEKKLLWPYEMHRYTAEWPNIGGPGFVPGQKAQVYVRGSSADVPGPRVVLPEQLRAQLMPFQEWVESSASGPRQPQAHAEMNSDRFYSEVFTKTTGPGDYYSLLQYQIGPRTAPGSEWVGFQVVKSVRNTDGRYFDRGLHTHDVGKETTDSYHQGPLPGYIYHLPGDHTEDKYDPKVYEEGGPEYATGQVIPVFKGKLEVWWSNVTTHGLTTTFYPVQWPSKVVRYDCVWPTDPEVIVIASQEGSGQIPFAHRNPEVYCQNDANKVGYNPNYEHARLFPLMSGLAAFALRCDLNSESNDKPYPYVLLKYRDSNDRNRWRCRVFDVAATDTTHLFSFETTVSLLIQGPYPIPAMPECGETSSAIHDGNHGVRGPYWQDRNYSFWARAAKDDGGTTEIVMRYWYPMQEGFYFPNALDNTRYPAGVRTPWLNRLPATYGRPVDVLYTVHWPRKIPRLKTGETLVMAKYGLPEIMGQCSVERIYESLNHSTQPLTLPGRQNVRLIDPIRERQVDLDDLPTGPDRPATENIGGKLYFTLLPPHLRSRITYDPINRKLELVGEFADRLGFEGDLMLMNVLTQRDRFYLYTLTTNTNFRKAVDALYEATSQPIVIGPEDSNSAGKAVVGVSAGNGGYVTLAMQNHDSCRPLPISLEIIRVVDDLFVGEIVPIFPDCCFDEKLTMRHSGDFAGKADQYVFKWEYHPDVDGTQPTTDSALWMYFPTEPETGSGALDVTIRGPGIFTLSDNWFRAKYRRTSDPDTGASYSLWTPPQLGPGWIKRVVGQINPFNQRATGGGIQGAEQKISAYQTRTVNTIVTMIGQAGGRWAGNVPLNCGPGLETLGLIEIYETVLGRGKQLSIDAGYKYPPANNALLLAAGRIADLYTLLGNEAYADAADPTIAFGTEDGTYGTEASSLHCFMNQTGSLLEEELGLLRGRDDSKAPGVKLHPLYNRLMWNFTRDITGGEVAYALNYNIQDTLGNVDGTISELDAMQIYPQGHGDAWGHYLTAITRYYDLLRHPNFDWVPRTEAVLVAGQPVTVDYLDERKFAKVAASKARTGAEIVNLTYRYAYVEDPAGQWQGYKDSDTSRAWGLSEWASRAGQGAYFDWVAANAILPDNDAAHTGIQKIDRTTVAELRDITASFEDIQRQVDQANIGLNPLGLAKNVVPFDIDPSEIEAGKTHFEQVYDRALIALNNAITVFDHATNCTQLLRRQADAQAEFQKDVDNSEADFNSRLIEIFGYPYDDDIGVGGQYPQGYNGPDLYHYEYVDVAQLLGLPPLKTQEFKVQLTDYTGVSDEGDPVTSAVTVTYHFSTDQRFAMVKPQNWGNRRAPGEIQQARSQLLQAYGQFEKARAEYADLVGQIIELGDLIDERSDLKDDKIDVLKTLKKDIRTYNGVKIAMKEVENIARRLAIGILEGANVGAEFVPRSLIAGLAVGGDLTAPARGGIKTAALIGSIASSLVADGAMVTQESMDSEKELAEKQSEIDIVTYEETYAIREMVRELRDLVRQEPAKRLEMHTTVEAIVGATGEYQAALAKGLRLLEDRTRFRTNTASKVQDYRYKDMGFRIFRNDALQKYRAQFDLAARYVYLTAKAYDYETNLLSQDRQAGQFFMTNIVRARSLGIVLDGVPQTAGGLGDSGLADVMARMNLNWNLSLKGQLGFNNPQTETNRFSLRYGFFRSATDDMWREVLRRHRVDNILDYPEFKRYCRVFFPHQDAEPGIVIPVRTLIDFGFNFFGRELAAGDSAYDSTNFATKVRSVGVWFTGYDALTSAGLSNTPRVYLIPVGYDIMRSPTGETGEIRVWKVLDQKLPVPFPIGQADLGDPAWIPQVDTLSEEYAAIRKYSSFRAFHDPGGEEQVDYSEMTMDSRLIGRSVWNTRWLLIIPAGSLHSDREQGIETFINGVKDIKMFFQTYAYSGN